MKIKPTGLLYSFLAGSSLLLAPALHAADGSWNVDADGDWGTDTNWTGTTIADGTDFTATFGNVITADRIINLDADRTIGNITASDTTHNYTISGDNILTLDVTSGQSIIDVTSNRELTISSVIAGSDGLSKSGAGSLFLGGANTFTGGIDLSAGRLVVSNNADEANNLGDASNVLTFSGDAEFYNANGGVTMGQGIQINTGVTASITGAFGESFQFDGVLSGDGTMNVQSYSASFSTEFRNTANTFTGNIIINTVDSLTLRMRSLADSVSTIGLDSAANNGAIFQLMSGATSGMTFNNRQFELIENGNSSTNLGRQARIQNNSDQAFTINTDLLVTGTGNKKLFLDSSTASGNNNNFNGAIIDAIGEDVLTLYKAGAGSWNLGGVNTYEGDTIVDAGTLTLAENAELLFVIGALGGENNAILGDASNAALNLDGFFRFNLTDASTTVNDSWNIVDVDNLTETYGSTFGVFSIVGAFTEDVPDSRLWSISENGTTYEFSEVSGVLTVVPEPSAIALIGLGGLVLLRRRRRG